ncbi:MAG TPA: hypothetical protein VII39_10490 [Bradyrhizobium sp.]
MKSHAFGNRRGRERTFAAFAKAVLVAALVALASLLGGREASANAAMAAAAQTADGGMGACGSKSGKALYDCIANVLDKLSNELSSSGKADVSSTRSALQTAASKLRAAVNKAQALSAITQCRALISGALAKVRAIGGGYVPGWGGGSGNGSALAAIAGVLGHAAKLIQAKG